MSRKFWLAVALVWPACGLIAGFQVWISMITHGHSVPLLVGFYVLIWSSWIAFTGIAVALTRRFPIVPPNVRNILVHVLAACVIGVVETSFEAAMTLLLRPYDHMTPTWVQMRMAARFFYNVPCNMFLYGAVVGAIHAIEYYSRLRARDVEAAQLQMSLTNARLHALELQIQPHFLFNTLHAITSLVRTRKNDEAVTMIAGLSDILRYSLEHEGTQCVTLGAEADILRRYLEIQRTRFADRMTYDIDVGAPVKSAAVPTLILQPLAENAVRHGVACSAAGGSVSVKAYRENGWLRVDIVNTGTLVPARDGGIGLRNTRERLQQLYGDHHELVLRQTGDGVLASLKVPWSEIV